MAQVTIQSVELSKSGKSHVIKSTDGQTYFSKPDQGLINHPGRTIDCDISTSEYNGKSMLWINKYKLLGEAAEPLIPAARAVIGHTSTPLSLRHAEQPPSMVWLPMASNTVAHAIQAGLIKEPKEVRDWVVAVKDAIENVNNEVSF